jgi:hypothetical protein
MSVHELWVERLFARLQVRYGNRWTRMWEGINPEAIKADWEQELGALYMRHPEALVYGLEHLPENPPTSDQFKAVCLRAPNNVPALPPPKVSAPGLAKKIAEQLATSGRPVGMSHAAYCAARLRTWKDRNGKKMTAAQRDVMTACEAMTAG